MKEFWLIAGSISLGIGLEKMDKGDKSNGAFQVVGGVLVILVGIFGFKK